MTTGIYVFLSARPGRGATPTPFIKCLTAYLFLSARPGRGATSRPVSLIALWMFLSARPGRGATGIESMPSWAIPGFYPHAPGGARPHVDVIAILRATVSIRTPRAGRDMASPARLIAIALFLSARPGRGATSASHRSPLSITGFYPHAPGGARLVA